jgi:hypothetical protein
MSYQYLYCAACGTRRAGHGYQCSVCGGLLRRDVRPKHETTLSGLHTTVRGQKPVTAKEPERQPVAA